ncbi:MAG: DUF1778 domain-containing protein [Candidatus Acidiferrales bacterium]
MRQTQVKKAARLEARISARQKRTIARAAQIRGLTFTDYVVTTLQNAAEETIRDSQVWRLRGAAQDAFVNAILNPPEPNAFARAAARRYKKWANK